MGSAQTSAHWSQQKRVSLEQAAPTSVGSRVLSPLYGNQLPHLLLQQGTLFLAFSAGRGRTCPYVGSKHYCETFKKAQETPRDVGKKQVHFWHPGWELSKFCVPLTSPHNTLPHPTPLSSMSQLLGQGKNWLQSQKANRCWCDHSQRLEA